MKLRMYFALLAMGALSLQSCDNDSDDVDNSKVPEAVRNTFTEGYPDTKNLKWETETVSQQQYYKAEFSNKKESDFSTSAWYTADGAWHMTETEMPYNDIPAAIRTAFEGSEYATWKKDNEVDKIERVGVELVYIIDVESAADEDIDLYYSESGVLVKAVSELAGDTGNNGSLLPDAPSATVSAVTAFIKKQYPNARIAEIDVEKDLVEVDIIDDNKGKEVLFDSSNAWLSTSWDVFAAQLPDAVKSEIAASQYSTYQIDDAEYFETPGGNYYSIDFEKSGQPDVDNVKITAL